MAVFQCKSDTPRYGVSLGFMRHKASQAWSFIPLSKSLILCGDTFVYFIFGFVASVIPLVDLQRWEAADALCSVSGNSYRLCTQVGIYDENTADTVPPLFIVGYTVHCDVRMKANCPVRQKFVQLDLEYICCSGPRLDFWAISVRDISVVTFYIWEDVIIMPVLSTPKSSKAYSQTLKWITKGWIAQCFLPLHSCNDLKNDDGCLAISV